MRPIENKTIAIVGGGPGGLTLARLLQMQGANVKVYERDKDRSARVQGATLDLHDDTGLAAIRAVGLMDAFKANYRPGADRVRIVDKHAAIIAEDSINSEEEFFRPEIDRGPLREILLDSLAADTVVWDSQFIDMVKQNGGWQLNFQDHKVAYADIVIAADGASSKIRNYITPVKPFYSGVTAVEGAVYNAAIACPAINQLLNGGKIFAFGDDKSLIVSSKGDGSLAYYIGLNTEESWVNNSNVNFKDKIQVVKWFKNEFTGWSNIWLALFEHSEYFIPRPQYCMPLDQSWQALPNLTMLGDAAHLMPPYAGEGVNMAMADALELSICLTSTEFSDTLSAIAAFEKQMLNRAAQAAKDTLESTAALHSRGAIDYISAIIN